MAGSRPRRILYLTTVCCLLAGSFLPLPGNGQNGSSASSNTVSQFTFSHTEAGITQATATSMENMITVIPQFNVSNISSSEYLTSTTLGSLNSTTSIPTTNYVTNRSTSSFFTPTTSLLETNQSNLDDKKYNHTTSWVTSSIKKLTTEISQSKVIKDQPSLSEANPIGKDPLVIAVIIIFVVTIGSLAVMVFLRYRQHINRLQFRHLQDLPMDDMMEDAPLSVYNY